MKVREKYAELINVASTSGVTGMEVIEKDGVLFVDGTVDSEDIRKRLWDIVAKIDTDNRAGDVVINDLVLNIKVDSMTGDASPEIKAKSEGYVEDVDKNFVGRK
jgi:hypothetical protein